MLFLMIAPVVLLALIPLYGILFPPLVDLPEHLIISKLLWEKLSGTTQLDLELPFFLGYRLFPVFMMIVMPFCKVWGISFIYLPRIVAMTLISLHATVVVTIFWAELKDRSWKSGSLAVCLALPAVVCMYSACWFIGFVNYTMAITLLVPAVLLSERFLRSGKMADAAWLFLVLLLVYIAHPFAPTFWILWCLGRALAAMTTRTLGGEWKKLLFLGVIFLPIVLYHALETAGTKLGASKAFLNQPIILSINDWYYVRLRGLWDGVFLQADAAADPRIFGLLAIGFILFATILALRSRQALARNLMLSVVFLIAGSSWVNERAIPIPDGHWIAYDYRFSSTIYVIGLVVSGLVLVRLWPAATDDSRYRIMIVCVAAMSVFASALHLVEVRKAYKRFDGPARKYMAKVFNYEQPIGIFLPRSRYHPDGSFLNHYVCLKQPDCNSYGTTFSKGISGNLYPVKVKSPKRQPTAR